MNYVSSCGTASDLDRWRSVELKVRLRTLTLVNARLTLTRDRSSICYLIVEFGILRERREPHIFHPALLSITFINISSCIITASNLLREYKLFKFFIFSLRSIFFPIFLQQTFIFYFVDRSRMMTQIDPMSRIDPLHMCDEFATWELLLATNSGDVSWWKVCRCRS